MFLMVHDGDGRYNARAHLAEMIALMGPPPVKLLRRELEGRKFRWSPPVENDEGVLCDRAVDFFGGPFFDSKGCYHHELPAPSYAAWLTSTLRGIHVPRTDSGPIQP
jgi:hypothetical protein